MGKRSYHTFFALKDAVKVLLVRKLSVIQPDTAVVAPDKPFGSFVLKPKPKQLTFDVWPTSPVFAGHVVSY